MSSGSANILAAHASLYYRYDTELKLTGGSLHRTLNYNATVAPTFVTCTDLTGEGICPSIQFLVRGSFKCTEALCSTQTIPGSLGSVSAPNQPLGLRTWDRSANIPINSTGPGDRDIRSPLATFEAQAWFECNVCSNIAMVDLTDRTVQAQCTKRLGYHWGCVYRTKVVSFLQSLSGATPTTSYPESAYHDKAVRDGSYSTFFHFTRSTVAQKNATRAAVRRRCRSGNVNATYHTTRADCDEFPFASMRDANGGTSSNIWKVYCRDNRNQGRAISRFYREQRILEGDEFRLKFTGSPSSPAMPSPLWTTYATYPCSGKGSLDP